MTNNISEVKQSYGKRIPFKNPHIATSAQSSQAPRFLCRTQRAAVPLQFNPGFDPSEASIYIKTTGCNRALYSHPMNFWHALLNILPEILFISHFFTSLMLPCLAFNCFKVLERIS